MALTKHAILSAADCAPQCVNVPEWGGDIYLRPMSGSARAKFEAIYKRADKSGDRSGVRGYVLCHTICNADSELLFTESDIEAIEEKNGDVLDRLIEHAMKVSGLGGDDENPLPETNPDSSGTG